MKQLNNLKYAEGSRNRVKRVGRGIGSTLGKTCGKGHKGQKARSGAKVKPGFEGGQMPMIRRVPKFGFNSYLSRVTQEVRLGDLQKIDDELIDLSVLKKKNIINQNIKRAKIINHGELTRKIHVKGLMVTKSVLEIIKQLGGEVS